jgi:lipoate-protein ligase B
MITQTCEVLDIGTRDYNDVWQLQKLLVEKRVIGSIPDQLILVEHPDVITVGRGGHRENILLPKDKVMPVYEIERGGDVTYHGPGQLVGYPILAIETKGIDLKSYVILLEKVIVETLGEYGLASEGRLGKETGVWVGDHKIASIGIAISRWVTFHGFALNVNTDLTKFQNIKPCGYDSSTMISMQVLLQSTVPLSDVKERIIRTFGRVFRYDMKTVPFARS